MPKFFEVYGNDVYDQSPSVVAERRLAYCPFTESTCDGGGNRHQTKIRLEGSLLRDRFSSELTSVIPGICSIQYGEDIWIVCPRRLLTLRNSAEGNAHQDYVKAKLAQYMELPASSAHRVWSEVKMKVGTTTDDDQEKFFDYSFDYVITGSQRKRLSEVAILIGRSERVTQKIAEENGFTLAKRGEYWIDDFPSDPVVIVEIMTSSTSGGDKKKRTQIAMAFEDAVLHPERHNGPGINYRQVWARMVSQRNSSSLKTPSAWLCRLVSGERTKRFFSVAPERSVSGSRGDVMGPT